MQSSSTYQEIMTQVDAWRDAAQVVYRMQGEIQRLWKQGAYDGIVFTGCGSTHYLSMTAASLTQLRTGSYARAVPSSELLINPGAIYPRDKRTLLVAISRSGATTETIQATESFVAQGRGDVMVVSCYDDKPLNRPASLNLAAYKGQEVSVAQTRSFAAMLVMVEELAKVLAGQALRDDMFADVDQSYIEAALRFAEQYVDATRFRQYYCLGGGPRYGLASEAMLKMKEMSLTNAEPFHPLEFRHGPKSMVDGSTVVIGLLGETGSGAEAAVLHEMKALGGTTIAIGPQADADFVLPAANGSMVYLLPVVQWLARQRAVSKGVDSDHPRNLESVIELPSLSF